MAKSSRQSRSRSQRQSQSRQQRSRNQQRTRKQQRSRQQQRSRNQQRNTPRRSKSRRTKRALNPFMKQLNKARNNKLAEFQYNGKTYKRGFLDTGMVIYSRK
tara:strand:+ start:688 stop:993 length:306 start_codon:yes stop_codon:yes gene_type:complete